MLRGEGGGLGFRDWSRAETFGTAAARNAIGSQQVINKRITDIQ